MHLDDAVQQLVILGERDPITIARNIIERNGEEWISTELYSMAEDLIAQMARTRLGNARRSAEVALRPGDYVAESRMKIAKMWIPGFGYKRVSELTAADLRAKASWYGAARQAVYKREVWCLQTAGLLDREGVTTVGELTAPLPALPEDDDMGLTEVSAA